MRGLTRPAHGTSIARHAHDDTAPTPRSSRFAGLIGNMTTPISVAATKKGARMASIGTALRSALRSMMILGVSTSVLAQEQRPPSAAAVDAPPRPVEPAATPTDATPPLSSTGAPLPPLPPAAPSEPVSAEAPAPPPPPPPEQRPRRLWFGGFGYAAIGPFFGDLSTLETALRSEDALGASYGIGRAGFTLGGGGGAILGGHLWLGGKGFGLLTAPFDNARGEAMLTGGGGGGELGYVLARPRMLIIPFFGIGGFGYDLEVTNRSRQAMPLQQVLSLSPGESRHFKAGFLTVELGVKVHRLLFSGRGGFMGGLEVGVLRSLSTAPWKSDRYEFANHTGALIEGVYARVTFGGGGGLSFR
jgi:hypothetical protein